jgi:hypothetical protein
MVKIDWPYILFIWRTFITIWGAQVFLCAHPPIFSRLRLQLPLRAFDIEQDLVMLLIVFVSNLFYFIWIRQTKV